VLRKQGEGIALAAINHAFQALAQRKVDERALTVGCMQVAKIIREDFLAQNAYSPYDPCCPFYKSVWMLKNMILFYTLALKSVELSGNDRKITLSAIKNVRRHGPIRFSMPESPLSRLCCFSSLCSVIS
jgi:vacuolar-type H+-ATPase catalytic subunit A/Vma1